MTFSMQTWVRRAGILLAFVVWNAGYYYRLVDSQRSGAGLWLSTFALVLGIYAFGSLLIEEGRARERAGTRTSKTPGPAVP